MKKFINFRAFFPIIVVVMLKLVGFLKVDWFTLIFLTVVFTIILLVIDAVGKDIKNHK